MPHYPRHVRRRFLASAAALTLLAAPALAQGTTEPQPTPQKYVDYAASLLGESVAFKTVEGEGQTERYAQHLAKKLRDGGFDAKDVSVEPMDGTAILIARYRGASDKPPIVLSAHMDVVSANAEDWTRDPFTMVHEGGYFFGRGVSDNKFGLVMLVTTLVRLKAEGFTPDRDIILALSGDEETQMKSTQVLAERLKDAEIVLNADGGGGTLDENGAPLAYYLQGAEKTYADFMVTFTNPGGHSSLPRSDNAIYDLANAATKIAKYKFPVQTSEVTLEFFRQTGAQTPGPLGEAMLKFAGNPNDKKAIREIAAHPEFVGQLGTTCVATMLEGGHAQNALPQRAAMNVNCRIFPGVSADEVQATLVKVIDNPSAEVKLVDDASASDASPLRDDIVAATRKAIDRRFPGLPIVPQMSAGASDSVHFRAQGVDSYGVSGLFMKPSDEFAHGLNERVPDNSIDGALDHWHTLLTELAGG